MRSALLKAATVGGAVALGAALPLLAASGPSFDCRKASGRIEERLCRDPKLAALDRRLAGIYAELRRESEPDTHKVVAEQQAFLKGRSECTKEEEDSGVSECLTYQYDERIRLLINLLPVWEKLRRPVSPATSQQVESIFPYLTGDDLYDVTSGENQEALDDVSCAYFTHSPKQAAELFAPASYSTRDAQTAICTDLDVSQRVPATEGLLAVLESVEGSGPMPVCTGTMGYGVGRTHQVARMMAVVEAHPDYAAAVRQRSERVAEEKSFGYHPTVAHWAIQGLAQNRLYTALQAEIPKAQHALVADYGRRFHLSPEEADRLAAYHIDQLVDSYTGRTGASSTDSYVSHCYTLADLRATLRSGKVPVKECPQAEFAEPGAKAVLRRLLELAIVNNSSLADVHRLIAAGADVNAAPVSFEYEVRETPLMLAAARSDVVAVLLAAGADPKPGNAFGKTALMYAIQERDLPAIRALLAAKVDVNAATNAKVGFDDPTGGGCALHAGSRTTLMYAAWHGNPEIVKLLLAAGADPRRLDSTGAAAGSYVGANRRLAPGERREMMDLLGSVPTGTRAALDGAHRPPFTSSIRP